VTPIRLFSAAGLAQIAVFVGVIAALGLVPGIVIPGVAVPITLQTLGVMLAGSVLGLWRGTAAVLVFLLLVALGLPLLAGGRGGLAVFFTPSAGFLIGFPFAAFVIGWLTERFDAAVSLGKLIAINVLGGIVVLYAFGIVGLSVIGQLSLAGATVISAVFLPGDLAKAVVAALVARGVHQALPDLLPERATRTPEAAASLSDPALPDPVLSDPALPDSAMPKTE
jgi:biotin transport system substrate-specific component